MTVKMIVAVDMGNAIGWADGALPWKIPADLKRFKELTTGGIVVMGRKTFDSLGMPRGLPNRQNVVLTKNPDAIPASLSVLIDSDLESLAKVGRHKDLWIIGGATVYLQAIQLKLVDEIYLTHVGVYSLANVVLPLNLSNVEEFIAFQSKTDVEWYIESKSEPQSTDDGITFSFVILKRRR